MAGIFGLKEFPHVVVLALAGLALALGVTGIVLTRRHTDRHGVTGHRMMNAVPVIGLSIVFLTLLDAFLKLLLAIESLWSSGTGDPRIIAGGIFEFLAQVSFYLMIGVAVMILWGVGNVWKTE